MKTAGVPGNDVTIEANNHEEPILADKWAV
jgi:hypothetical protein